MLNEFMLETASRECRRFISCKDCAFFNPEDTIVKCKWGGSPEYWDIEELTRICKELEEKDPTFHGGK